MNNNKGIATIVGLIVIMVLSILASVLLRRGIVNSHVTEVFIDQKRAFWAAEAGVEKAIWELNNGSWNGWTTQGNNKILQDSMGSAGDYDVTVYDYSNPTLRIEASGFLPNRAAANPITRKIELIATQMSTSLFEYAAYSEGTLSMLGQAFTDSYDSSLGPYGGANVGSLGDVGSNTEVSPSGRAYVNGDVSIPVDGDVPDAQYYSGSVEEENNPPLEEVSVPENLASLPDGGSLSSSTTLNPGDYKYWMINLASSNKITLVGPINLYLTGGTSISVSGQAEIIVDPNSTGPVNIYFDGDVNLSGQGITNATSIPSNLIMYGTNSVSQNINLAGQNDFYGAVYAPTSTMNLSGQGRIYGAFVGNEVSISGQGGVHYDVQLGSAGGAAVSRYVITAFRDTQSPYNLSP